MTIQYILSQIFIIMNYVFLIMTYQSKSRKGILIYNIVALISAGLSYICLSAYSGLAMTIVSIIRNIIFVIDEKKNGVKDKNQAKDYIILAILYIISIILAIFTYNGILSMMSVVATMLYTYSIWQKNTRIYKVLGVLVSIVGIIYNIYIFSIFGIILEAITSISAIIGYIREYKSKKLINKNKEETMELVYKKIKEEDKTQVFSLIETVLSGLENQEYFIPYEQWELDSMFDEENYAPLYGAYDGDKLVRNGSVICIAGYA